MRRGSGGKLLLDSGIRGMQTFTLKVIHVYKIGTTQFAPKAWFALVCDCVMPRHFFSFGGNMYILPVWMLFQSLPYLVGEIQVSVQRDRGVQVAAGPRKMGLHTSL